MNVQECAQSVRNEQVLPVYDVEVGKDFTIELIKMDQVTDAIMKCEMVKETSTKVVDQLVQELGLKVEDVSKTKKKTDLKSEAKSEDALGNIGKGIGNMLSGFGTFSEIFDVNKTLTDSLLNDTGIGGYLPFAGGSSGLSAEALEDQLKGVTGVRNEVVYNWQEWFDNSIKEKYQNDSIYVVDNTY